MTKRPAAEIVQVKLRMRGDLRRKLEREADNRGLTINAEILRRLETFEQFEDVLGGNLAPEVLIIAGQLKLAHQQVSAHAPPKNRIAEVTARVCASIAGVLWPECKWVTITDADKAPVAGGFAYNAHTIFSAISERGTGG